MKDYAIDDVKYSRTESGITIQIHGWVFCDNFKILVRDEKKKVVHIFTGNEKRYDICLQHKADITESLYGFDCVFSVSSDTDFLSFYCVEGSNDSQFKMFSLALIEAKEKKAKFNNILNTIRKRLFYYKNYEHRKLNIVTIVKKAIQKIGSQSTYTLYDPCDSFQYNEWLKNAKEKNIKKKLKDITFITQNTDFECPNYPVIHSEILEVSAIKTPYICFVGKQSMVYDSFFGNVNLESDADVYYFDNDSRKDTGERHSPQLKPDFSFDTLQNVNYIGHLFVVKKELLTSLNGTKIDLYSYLLEISKKTNQFEHVSKILYYDNEKNERNEKNISLYKGNDLVTIVIPTKDHKEDLNKCIRSIYTKSTYSHFEIVIVNNNSEKSETFDYFEKMKKEKTNLSVIDLNCEFNYSFLNNYAVNHCAKGQYILLLNNDIEVISPHWLENMLYYASQKDVGSVGAFLLFPDNTIQHAGVVMGKGGVAGHIYSGQASDISGVGYELKVPYNVSCCTAACLMIRKDVYQNMQGLNENLKVAFNDVDFGLRLLEKGYRNVFLPDVKLYHYESKSRGTDKSAEQLKRYYQECEYMKETWDKYIRKDPFYNVQYSRNDDYKLKG